jgi:hypothetical protein
MGEGTGGGQRGRVEAVALREGTGEGHRVIVWVMPHGEATAGGHTGRAQGDARTQGELAAYQSGQHEMTQVLDSSPASIQSRRESSTRGQSAHVDDRQ